MYCPRCGTQNKDTAKFCDSCGLDLSAATATGAARIEPPADVAEIDLVREQLRDEYEILEELGRGGMAIVFRAREHQLEREVAIKVLPFSLAFDKEFVERFQREARTAAKLEHPAIIPIYRVGKSGRVIYFVMKFLRGKPLSDVLAARRSLPPAEIRRILMEVGRALAYAHKSGIVHRDIKPDNIMFDEHGQSVVTDFGIAKAASGGKLTGTGMAIGTPHYMSPEQARAQGLDGRSDIYSLGVVAYQCLTGSVPFDGEDSFSIGYKHIMEELPVPPLDHPEKRDLFEVIRQMMAKAPDERFQTADELVAVLENSAGYVATGISTAATRAMPSLAQARIAGAPTTPIPRVGDALRARRPAERSVMAGVLLWVLIVGTVFGGGAFYAYRQGWIFDAGGQGSPPDTRARADSARAGTPGADSARADTGRPGTTGTGPDTVRAPLPPPGPPGRLTLLNLPSGARVTLDGQPVRGTQVDLAAGSYQLAVRAPGYELYERQVVIASGTPTTLRVQLRPGSIAGGGGPCDLYGPEYNKDDLCFDTRPTPLTPTFVPVAADADVFPRQAILLIHVSRTGETLSARIFVGSNVETFNSQALDMARALRWNPAQKNGEPTEAWVQQPFLPQRP